MTTSPTTLLRTGPGRLWLSFGSPEGTREGVYPILTFTLFRPLAKPFPIPAPSKKKHSVKSVLLIRLTTTPNRPSNNSYELLVLRVYSVQLIPTSQNALANLLWSFRWRVVSPYSNYRIILALSQVNNAWFFALFSIYYVYTNYIHN